MRLRFITQFCGAVVITAISNLSGAATAQSNPATGLALHDFIDAASYRLALADQVALTKWDSRKPIEDGPREKVVIDAAVAKATEKGLPEHRVRVVFADQVEANKLVQYRLLAQWERAGGAPATARPNLVLEIRPTLDRLQIRLIDDMAGTADLSARPDCARQVAVAVGEYVSEKNLDALHALALDRALARICEK
jgi:chorismate mutase